MSSNLLQLGTVSAYSLSNRRTVFSGMSKTKTTIGRKAYMRNKFKGLVVLAAGIFVCAGVANAIPLGTLAPAGTITIGDKTFSNFGWQSANSQLNAEAAVLDVTASVSGGIYYLDFSGLIALNGGTLGALGDLKLTYTVTANPGAITYIDQLYTPNALPSWGQITIGETVKNGATIYGTSTLTLNPTDLSDPQPEAGDLLQIVPPQKTLNVVKDILISANPNELVGLSNVEQSFHQPDGGLTVALLGFALVGVEGLRRKLAR